jgi:hypothetical protein
MEDSKPTPFPFQSGVKLPATCTSLEVDATLYHRLVGILLSLSHTCHDLSFIVVLVTQCMQSPREIHWKEVKTTLQYVQSIVQFGIH